MRQEQGLSAGQKLQREGLEYRVKTAKEEWGNLFQDLMEKYINGNVTKEDFQRLVAEKMELSLDQIDQIRSKWQI